MLTEKAEMLKKHLKDTNSELMISANIEPNIGTFKFYNQQEEDSLRLHYTFSNLGDSFKEQLYGLWVQLNNMLKEHYPDTSLFLYVYVYIYMYIYISNVN